MFIRSRFHHTIHVFKTKLLMRPNNLKHLLLKSILFLFVLGVNAVSYLPSDPNIQYHGRWNSADPSEYRTEWSSTYFKVRFTGSSIEVKITSSSVLYYEYQLDGGPWVKTTSPGVIAASGSGEHSLKFVRLNAGNHGYTLFQGLEVTGGVLLDPGQRRCLQMEFVGNSITTGWGNDGGQGGGADVQNGRLAWGPVLAEKFNAEWRVEAHSGQGMHNNLYEYGQQDAPGKYTMADEWEMMYEMKHGGDEYTTVWPFTDGYQPDVFFCSLGTNDFAQNSAYPTCTEFNGRYNEYLDLVRGYYPDATIILFGTNLPTWGAASVASYDSCNRCLAELVDYRNNVRNDANIYFANPKPGNLDANLWVDYNLYLPDNTHPNGEGHQIIATKMKAFMDAIPAIKDKLDQTTSGCITSIKEMGNINQLKVYPNPMTDDGVLEMELTNPSDVNFEIYSIEGRLIDSAAHNMLARGKHSFQLNMLFKKTNLTGGSYLIKVISGRSTSTIISILK